MPSPADSPTPSSHRSNVLSIATTLADTTARLAVPTLGLAGLGLWGDLSWGTKPWLTLTGTAAGFVIAGFLINRQIKDIH